MLEINKTITLNGTSTVNGQIVVNMHASLSTDGKTSGNINKNIYNLELYNEHKTDARADMAEFETEVYKVEDGLNTVSRKVGK